MAAANATSPGTDTNDQSNPRAIHLRKEFASSLALVGQRRLRIFSAPQTTAVEIANGTRDHARCRVSCETTIASISPGKVSSNPPRATTHHFAGIRGSLGTVFLADCTPT